MSESVYVQLSIQCHLSAGTRHNPQIHSSPQSLIYSDHTFIILHLLSNEEVKLDVLISFKNLRSNASGKSDKIAMILSNKCQDLFKVRNTSTD